MKLKSRSVPALLVTAVLSAMLAASHGHRNNMAGPAPEGSSSPTQLFQEALTLASIESSGSGNASFMYAGDRLKAMSDSFHRTAVWVERHSAVSANPAEAGYLRNLLLNARDKVRLTAPSMGGALEVVTDTRIVDLQLSLLDSVLPAPGGVRPGRALAAAHGAKSGELPEEALVDQLVRRMNRSTPDKAPGQRFF